MSSLIGYGMLAYLLVLVLPGLWSRRVAVGSMAVLILGIGFSRMYLGAHYLSDVAGGYAAGTVWLTGWISAIELVRRRPHRRVVAIACEADDSAPVETDSAIPRTSPA